MGGGVRKGEKQGAKSRAREPLKGFGSSLREDRVMPSVSSLDLSVFLHIFGFCHI